jgi:hypothetical protein
MDSIVIHVYSLFCKEITIFLLKLGMNYQCFRPTALFFKKMKNLWVRIMNLERKVKN